MLKQDLIAKNPLRILNQDAKGNQIPQRMGLVMARAGLGKTAILVQIALDSILRGNRVIHVSIGQSLDKTKTWYDDIFKDIAAAAQLEHTPAVVAEIMLHRMIMTFNATSFNRPKLEERLNDLVQQDVFRPNCLIIDGFDFSKATREELVDLRELMAVMDLNIWFSAVSHREDNRTSANGVPAPCHELEDLFDTIMLIQPEQNQKFNKLKFIKDTTGCVGQGTALDLDPVSLIIQG
ncbi:MAG: hypothetical protein OEV91_11385 [Desulfobulbaceae bacterium]|nr:hypothetical protein [Desulfobulbaceae bacterium]